MSDDPELSERYRGLPREEPPRALDEAILAASRRAVRRRRGWYGPLAAAAVITLAVAVTLHVQRDRPSEEVDAVSPSMKVEETPAPPAQASDSSRGAMASGQILRQQAPKEERYREAPPPAAAPAAPAAAEAKRNEAAAEAAGARASPAPAPEAARRTAPMLAKVARSPEQWLQGIADLRRQGRHEEADRELAEFRKRYPDYRLSDEMKAKVEKPQ